MAMTDAGRFPTLIYILLVIIVLYMEDLKNFKNRTVTAVQRWTEVRRKMNSEGRIGCVAFLLFCCWLLIALTVGKG
jgi:hypothetical protein